MSGSFNLYLKEVLEIEGDPGDGSKIGLNDYPIWKPAYRPLLNSIIIEHFWNREMGLETISLFTFNLRRKMHEIMPLYNQVFASTEIEFDPLATFNLTTTRADTAHESNAGTNTSGSTGTTTSAARTVNSETPQTELSGDEDYASSATDANSSAASNNSSTGNSSNTGSRDMEGNSTTKGFQGSAADLLTKYRQTFINPNMMVVGELNELFMGVWDNRSEMLPYPTAGYGMIEGYYL